MRRAPRVVVAIPDEVEARAAQAALEAARHLVRCCAPEVIRRHVDAFRPDLVIVAGDDGAPGVIASTVRAVLGSPRPLVLAVVPPGTSATSALEAGADACITRPYEPAALEIHVEAILRRVPWLTQPIHQVGALVVDEGSHQALFEDSRLTLTAKEFAILATLARDAGRVVSKRSLLQHVWGFEAFDENLVEVQVCGLRRHLPSRASSMVQTVRGFGYVLRGEVAQATSA